MFSSGLTLSTVKKKGKRKGKTEREWLTLTWNLLEPRTNATQPLKKHKRPRLIKEKDKMEVESCGHGKKKKGDTVTQNG